MYTAKTLFLLALCLALGFCALGEAAPPPAQALIERAVVTYAAYGEVDTESVEALKALGTATRHIGARAFQGCINLFQVKLGRSVECIGEDAFDDCESLEAILVPAGTRERFLSLLPKNLHEIIEES